MYMYKPQCGKIRTSPCRKVPNILVCGKPGAGKTSLIQAVTRKGVVPDGAICYGRAAAESYDAYETGVARFIEYSEKLQSANSRNFTFTNTHLLSIIPAIPCKKQLPGV